MLPIQKLAGALAVLATLASFKVQADPVAEQRLRDALRQTTLDMRAARDENVELKIQLDALKAKAATREKAPAPNPASAAALEKSRRELHAQSDRVAELEQALAAAESRQREWQDAYEKAAALARDRDAQATTLKAQWIASRDLAQSCRQKNTTLVSISEELLDRFKNKSIWSTLADHEPLTGLHRVELEKLAQEYHEHIADQTVSPTAAPVTGSP